MAQWQLMPYAVLLQHSWWQELISIAHRSGSAKSCQHTLHLAILIDAFGLAVASHGTWRIVNDLAHNAM